MMLLHLMLITTFRVSSENPEFFRSESKRNPSDQPSDSSSSEISKHHDTKWVGASELAVIPLLMKLEKPLKSQIKTRSEITSNSELSDLEFSPNWSNSDLEESNWILKDFNTTAEVVLDLNIPKSNVSSIPISEIESDDIRSYEFSSEQIYSRNFKVEPESENSKSLETCSEFENMSFEVESGDIKNWEISSEFKNIMSFDVEPESENITSLEVVSESENITSSQNEPGSKMESELINVTSMEATNVQSAEIKPELENIKQSEVLLESKPSSKNITSSETEPGSETSVSIKSGSKSNRKTEVVLELKNTTSSESNEGVENIARSEIQSESEEITDSDVELETSTEVESGSEKNTSSDVESELEHDSNSKMWKSDKKFRLKPKSTTDSEIELVSENITSNETESGSQISSVIGQESESSTQITSESKMRLEVKSGTETTTEIQSELKNTTEYSVTPSESKTSSVIQSVHSEISKSVTSSDNKSKTESSTEIKLVTETNSVIRLKEVSPVSETTTEYSVIPSEPKTSSVIVSVHPEIPKSVTKPILEYVTSLTNVSTVKKFEDSEIFYDEQPLILPSDVNRGNKTKLQSDDNSESDMINSFEFIQQNNVLDSDIFLDDDNWRHFNVNSTKSAQKKPSISELPISTDNIENNRNLCGTYVRPQLIAYKNKYYYIEFWAKMDWISSLAYCNQLGMKLVAFHAHDELQMIVDRLARYDLLNLKYWTSASNMENNYKFRWMSNGAKLKNASDLWAVDNPIAASNNSCVYLYLGGDYKLKNTVCSKQLNLICQITDWNNNYYH